MYCSIREFNEYDFTGDLSKIGEVMYRYSDTDIVEKLEMTKESDRTFVFVYSNIPSDDDLIEMNMLLEVRQNVKIMFYNMNAQLLPEDKTPKGKYFYSYHSLNIDNFDMLKPILSTGVSDIYISGMIGFEMKKLKEMCEAASVNVRVLPNLATKPGISEQLNTDDTTSFWIRPEDLKLYEPYVDVVEFNCGNEKQSVYYDIYFQNESWRGNLSEIIVGNIDIKNKGLTSHFTDCRLNCGKKCLFDLCHKCHKLAALAEIVVENKLELETEEGV